MIESLGIGDLAIVERADLEFAPGLNVLTGETGAGKSIVLGALSLLTGGRSAARLVRSGCEQATVEALFRTEALADLERELVESGFEGDGHELIVRRSVSANGRSRAQVSGQLAPIATLQQLFQGRVEISSQHDSQSLLRTEHHGELLDRWAGLDALRGEVAADVEQLRSIARELEALRQATREREQRRDFLAFQVQEIDEAKLEAEESEHLHAARSRLAHADRLARDGGTALGRLSGDPNDPSVAGASDHLREAARSLDELARLDPALAPIGERLRGLVAESEELAGDLERHLDGLEADPARLAQIEERLHRIEALQRKYGANAALVLEHRDAAAAELAALDGADAREAELESERAVALERLGEHARKLSEKRKKAATALARAVEPVLRELAMPEARFGVALNPAQPVDELPCGPTGAETPEFVLSANKGEALQPLRKVASGGELSRAFLALKQVLREQDAGMVLVFDEVDAGVGGEAADRVGKQLAELAAHHQVLCITHLPQIAAYAERHFRVLKQSGKKRTGVRIEAVSGEQRIEELARMASGASAGEAARDYARELLLTRGGRNC